MTTPTTLTVSNALAYAKTSGNPIAVADSGYYIANAADALVALGGQLVSIQETSSFFFPWPISAADALALAPKLTNSMGMPDTFTAITGSAADIAAHASQLLALGAQVAPGGIAVTDTAANVAAHVAALVSLGGGLSVNLSDSTANVAANAAALAQLGGQLFVGLTDTAANLAANAAALAKLGASLSLTVADTVAHINASQAKLLGLGASLTGLSLPDGTTLAVKDMDGKSLTLFSGSAVTFFKEGLTAPVHVADYGAYIASNADALAALSGKLLSVQETSLNSAFLWAISAADVVALAPKMTNSQGNAETFSNVTDSAAHVLAQLDGLQAINSRISAIALTDKGAASFALSATQYSNDAPVLGKINSPYSISISGATAANVAAEAKNSHVAKITVADSAAHVAASLDALQGNSAKLGAVTLTDSAAPTMTITAAQASNDQAALNAIGSAYTLSVQDSAANLNSMALNSIHGATGNGGAGLGGMHVEIMPTSLAAAMTIATPVYDVNLSMIHLAGDSINEKAYNGTGTELDIMAGNGTALGHLYFTQDTEVQLHLLGIGNTPVHLM